MWSFFQCFRNPKVFVFFKSMLMMDIISETATLTDKNSLTGVQKEINHLFWTFFDCAMADEESVKNMIPKD